MSLPSRLAVAVTAGAAILLPAAATSHAATRVEFVGSELRITDTAGAAQKISVTGGTFDVVLQDTAPGATVVVGPGCVTAGFPVATCTPPAGGVTLRADLGDGDDELLATTFEGPATIDVGAGNDTIRGTAGNDTLTGGTGADTLSGEGGDDVLELRDTAADAGIDCGAGGADVARIDGGLDPEPVACETVERTGGGGGGTTSPPSETPVSTATSFTMPDLRPRVSATKIGYQSTATLTKALAASGFIPKLTVVREPLKDLPAKYRDTVSAQKVVSQSPAPGTKLSWQVGQQLPPVKIVTYDPSLDLPRNRCPVNRDAAMKTFFTSLRGATYTTAMSILKRQGCPSRTGKITESRTATDTTVAAVRLLSTRGDKDRVIELDLVRPKVADLAIMVADRAGADWAGASKAKQAELGRQLGLGADSRLTALVKQPTALQMMVSEIATGRAVARAPIDIRSPQGELLKRATTDAFGRVTVELPRLTPGKLQLDIALRTRNEQVLEGWGTIPVVDRGRDPFATIAGRFFTWSRERSAYVPSSKPTSKAQQQLADIARSLTTIATDASKKPGINVATGGLGGSFGSIAEALGLGARSPSSGLPEAVSKGLVPGKLLAGGTTTSTFKPGTQVSSLATMLKQFLATGLDVPSTVLSGFKDSGVAAFVASGLTPAVATGGGGLFGAGAPGAMGSPSPGTVSGPGSAVLPIGGLPALGFLDGLFGPGPLAVVKRAAVPGDPSATTLRVY